MNTFNKLLIIGLLTTVTNNFVWFALTYWLYLTTNSVISTSTASGIWLVSSAISGIFFGSIVDHNKKKHVMIGSSIVSFLFFLVGYLALTQVNHDFFSSVFSPTLWGFVLILLSGVLSGTIYNIAIPTLVAILVPEEKRDRANGLYGTIIGIAFAITSVVSGLALAMGGMKLILGVAVILTLVCIVNLIFVPITEKEIIHIKKEGETKIDIKGTIKAIKAVPGLFGLIMFTTFNNFLGGVFMSLMDAYGLSLVSVQVWGIMWGVLSFGFIVGGMYIAKKGLGDNPLNTLFRNNIIMWIVCIFFTIQPSIYLLGAGIFVWMCLVPFVEATEQTIFQKVVSPERLGRVFGFAHSVEVSAAPLTAFMIGPLAQFVFIPFMTTGPGVDLIGSWFGTGTSRGIALVFITAGIIGLIVTLLAKRSRSYALLSERYKS